MYDPEDCTLAWAEEREYLREPWRSLYFDPFNQIAAEVRFTAAIGGRQAVPALNPHHPLGNPIGVRIPMPDRLRHLLVKDGRYQLERARRIDWVLHGLREPDRLYMKDDGRTVSHYYACDVSDHEEFVVIVHEEAHGGFRLGSAIPYRKDRWHELKGKMRAGPPIKREGPPEGDP